MKSRAGRSVDERSALGEWFQDWVPRGATTARGLLLPVSAEPTLAVLSGPAVGSCAFGSVLSGSVGVGGVSARSVASSGTSCGAGDAPTRPVPDQTVPTPRYLSADAASRALRGVPIANRVVRHDSQVVDFLDDGDDAIGIGDRGGLGRRIGAAD